MRVRDVDCPDGDDVSAGSELDCRVPAVEDGRRVVYTARVVVGDDGGGSWRLTAVRAGGAATAR